MTGEGVTGGGVTGGGGDSERFELEVRPPFRLDLTAWVLRRRPDNHVDNWDGTTYRRVLRVDGAPIDVAATQHGTVDRPRLSVALTAASGPVASRARREVTARLQRMLGLDLDTAAFIKHVSSDPAIGPLARRFSGVKPPRFPTVFECLVNSIACQQLTLTFGIALLDRLARAHGPTTPTGTNGGFGFPEPSDLADVEPDAFRALGFSHAKARAIIELAQRVTSGELDLDGLDRLDDAAAIARLLELRGIGRWSAEYALLRGFGRVQVFPGDDVGARNNLARRLGIPGPLDYAAVREVTSRWDPYAGFVYFHLLLERIETAGWLTAPGPHATAREPSSGTSP